MKLLLVIYLVFIGFVANSQSLTTTLTNVLPDSITKWQGFRAAGPMAMYGYNKSSGNSLMTGVGIAYDFEHLTSGGTWWVDYAIGLAFYAGGSQAPSSLSLVSAAGPYVSLLNGFVSIGGAINFTTGKPMVTIGVVLPLIPN